MDKIWNFIVYCFKNMFGAFAATIGHAPKDYTWKNMIVGIITLIVILGAFLLLLRFLGVISFSKKK